MMIVQVLQMHGLWNKGERIVLSDGEAHKRAALGLVSLLHPDTTVLDEAKNTMLRQQDTVRK